MDVGGEPGGQKEQGSPLETQSGENETRAAQQCESEVNMIFFVLIFTNK